MSKSLGNSPDPLDVIAQYGADALRFTIIYLAPLGQDVLFSVDKCEIGRNFANKIWNAGRFLLLNSENIKVNYNLKFDALDLADKWILSRLNSTIKNYTEALTAFKINDASKTIYNFIWSDYCDWYVELVKARLTEEKDEFVKSALLSRAFYIYENILKLLHPIMPFITEEIFQTIYQLDSSRKIESKIITIMNEKFPVVDEQWINQESEQNLEILQELISSIRNIRGEMNIPPSKKCDVHIKAEDKIFEDLVNAYSFYIEKLAKVENILIGKNIQRPRNSSVSVIKGNEIYIPLEGLIDVEVEKERLKKEIERLEKLLEEVNKKLSNQNFVSRAPEDVVQKEREKQRNFSEALEKVRLNLTMLEDN